MAAYSPEAISEIFYSVNEYVDNVKNPHVIDRKNMPWWSTLTKMKKEGGTSRGVVTIKYKRDGGLTLQFWEGRDILQFQEARIDFELTFPYAQVHLGEELVHQELEDAGYVVVPNAPRGGSLGTKNSKDENFRLVNLLEEKMEEMQDNWDREMDKTFLLDGSQDPLAPVGLDGLMPVDPTSGTLGGKFRTDPLIQHQVATGITTGVGGNLDQTFNQLIRAANLNSRGFKGRINFMMTGAEGLDRYISYAKANNFEYKAGIEGISKMDVGVADSAVHFQGTPIIHNPTMDDLATTDAADWGKRFYMLNSSTWSLFHAPKKWKHFSAPLDAADQRVSRYSLDFRGVLIPMKINGNALGILD